MVALLFIAWQMYVFSCIRYVERIAECVATNYTITSCE